MSEINDEALEERAEKALEDVTRLRSDRDDLAQRVADLERRLEAALATDLRCEHCGETYQTTVGAELQAERDDLMRRLKQAERERDEAHAEVVYWKERTDAAHQIAEADRLELRARRAVEAWVAADPDERSLSDETTKQAMLGTCEACGRPASDMCDCCVSCHRLQRRLAESEHFRNLERTTLEKQVATEQAGAAAIEALYEDAVKQLASAQQQLARTVADDGIDDAVSRAYAAGVERGREEAAAACNAVESQLLADGTAEPRGSGEYTAGQVRGASRCAVVIRALTNPGTLPAR